ncbi:MAG: S8 family peptidase [Pseudomonadota bacterium]
MATHTAPSRWIRRFSDALSVLRAACVAAACAAVAASANAEDTVQLIVNLAATEARAARGTDTLRVVRVPAASAEAVMDTLRQADGVAHVEVDGRVFPASFDDPRLPEQWALTDRDTNPAGTDLVQAWLPNRAQVRVTVAVVDTGLLLDHLDSADTLPGYDFVSAATTANDGNGRDADPSDPGDWVSAFDISNGIVEPDCPVQASTWHGTGVAGVLAAKRNNGTGIAGAATGIDVLPVRVMGKCGGRVSDLIAGIRWAAGLEVFGAPDNPNPAQIINLSLGINQACTPAMQLAIDDARRAGAMVITAAGNANTDMDDMPQAPASCDGVFTVAAAARDGSKSSYSNFGSAVALAAPGGEPNDGVITTEDSGVQAPAGDHVYGHRFGTSIATPHVSATAAMMLAVNPLLSNDAVAATLQQTSNAFPRACDGCGAGLLNASAAVRVAAGLPASDDGSPNTRSVQGGGATLLGLGVWLLAWRQRRPR